ncbi:MAG: hypothetical protein NAOJABEB_00707 [Steroidobacteraceae bacterium]|nr:hypothetical protein [Steroidobacteraceae bacterium]
MAKQSLHTERFRVRRPVLFQGVLAIALLAGSLGARAQQEVPEAISRLRIGTDWLTPREQVDATGLAIVTGALPVGKGLTGPADYFESKSAAELSEALTVKLGPAKSVGEGAKTFYNQITRRSFNVHSDPAHGPPYVDIRRRGGYQERQYP